MSIANKKEILDKLTATHTSKWEEKATWRQENQEWLIRSQEIALKVLHALRQKNMSQRDLARLLNCSAQHVSKLVSGKENLTLETISRLEDVLGMRLISILSFSMTIEVSINQPQHHIAEGHLINQAESIRARQPLSTSGAYFVDEQLEVA